jgi:uncharacterized protein
MDKSEIISRTINFVKETLKNAEGGHDWFHIERVWKCSKQIGSQENVDLFIVELGALLHDIADSKFNDGDESIGPKMAGDFLSGLGVDRAIISKVQQIIENISFKGGNHQSTFSYVSTMVVLRTGPCMTLLLNRFWECQKKPIKIQPHLL